MPKILIVDDEYDILSILKRWLSHRVDWNVTCCQNPTDAAEQLKTASWDLIISDIYMPGSDGIDIFADAATVNPGCKVLFMTGHPSAEIAMRAVNMQADGFLTKPIKKSEFIAQTTKLLSQRERRFSHKQNRVLAIGAHPDDVEIGCGGILLQHAEAGDSVHILTLSNGENGGLSHIRKNEAKAAAALLKAQLHFGGLQDTKITEGPETIEVIEQTVQLVRPDIIYTHSHNDQHQDHRNVHQATVVAARHIEHLNAYQSPSASIAFKPSRFVDISDMLEGKLNLLNCYASQLNKCAYLRQSLICATAEYWGRFCGYGLVEPLEVLRSA